ncbi:uncharacterized protein LOC129776098 isoform X1 [Toxorhynchites rutilus septentrionalis]|uniref:uncharacterized protein LOC129776098 isoform X1 n=1 Tax=Toxorhynchites rutilus septentrionalis TaxID=329112 RepID=UPI002478A3AD|nr:uncharacterized protein LOC129776098 isoform X1 [Toxorhynchites rutilus septentrionalis]
MRVSINTPEDCTINEQFIKLVQETPMLWNLHLPQYRNRELKEQKWAEVGALFNLSGTDAYKKFVALREKYKREQKLRESKSIALIECWRLYDNMKFLDTVSFSRDRRWTKPKHIIKNQKGPPMVLLKQDLAALIKSEFPEMHTSSTPTSPSYQISGEPSENGSNETYHDNSDFYNESTTQGANSDGADYGERIESIPDVHLMAADTNPGSSHESKILHRLESSTSGVLENYDRRKHSWARCETLGQRVAQTMYALEEHDPDLALKFDIMLSESITSIKKDQLQRLMSRKQMQQEEQQRNRNSEDSSLR